MEGFFITEAETERWLETETREVPMPDGSVRRMTGFRLTWYSWDYLILCGKYSKAQLVEFTLHNCREYGYDFDECFPSALAYLHRGLRKAQGID